MLALICSILGVLPHQVFSWHLGTSAFWQGAWDEGFYILALYGEIPDWNSYPLKQGLAWAVTTLELSETGFAILADAILPAILTVSAGALALTVFRRPAAVLMLSFCLVFGSDIFGLNSTVAFFPGTTLNSVLTDLSLYQRQFFADAYTTYLHVFRTPEPQLSLSFLFLHLAVLVLFVSWPEKRTGLLALFAITSGICSLIYSFFSLAALSCSGAAVLALLISRDRDRIWPFILITIAGISATLLVILSSYSNEASSVLFHARTPMISPALVYGVLGCFWIAERHGRAVLASPLLLFSVALLLFPLAALNQQLVSGVMIQTLNWERYVNIPLVLVGLTNAARVKGRPDSLIRKLMMAVSRQWQRLKQALKGLLMHPRMQWIATLWSRVQHMRWTRAGMARGTTASLLVLALLFIAQAQWRAYQQFLHYNVLTQGYAQAADQALQQDDTRGSRIILDNMHFDAPIRVRSHAIQDQLAGYSWIVTTTMAERLRDPTNTDLPEHGYQVAARLGLSTDAYQARLQRELDGAYCWPHLMYLAPFLECAPYVSDFRRYNPVNLQAIVDRNVADYASYLANPKRLDKTPALILSSTPLEGADENPHWRTRQVFITEVKASAGTFLPAASATIYVYRQASGSVVGK
ncbi:MAG: hypothetical protein AAFP68_02520 [Pseudomonadota bacterium]